VKKTSVYLDEEHSARLKRLAALQQRSQSQVLRDAISEYAEKVAQSREFACAGVAEGPGDSVADIPEEELLKGFGQ
jgi:predicted transcriptional regulator